MRSSLFISAIAALVSSVTAADAVKGSAEGFAKGKHIQWTRILGPHNADPNQV